MTVFDTAWEIVKRQPVDPCIGCGMAHGTPNSKYCSEICERQDKEGKIDGYDV